MAGEVNLQATLSKDYVPITGQPQLVYVLIDAMPTEMMASTQMMLNLSLVLDTSGSMGGDKITRLKEAVNYVIDMLNPDDTLSIITFDSKTKTLLRSQRVGSAHEKEGLKRQVDKLGASGGTNMAPAMNDGLAEVRKQHAPSRVNRMILLTDGDTNGPKDCLKEASRAAAAEVPIIALGVGSGWKEDLLLEISQKTGGAAGLIEHAHEIEQFLQGSVQAMQATVVKNAQLTVRLVGGVTPRRVWRLVPMISDLGHSPIADRHIVVPLGELEKDQGQGILVELLLPARQPGTYRIAQAEMSYDVPSMNRSQEKARADLLLHYTYDPNLARQVNPRVMNTVEKVTAFKLQTRALEEAEVGNIVGATQKLRSAVTILLNQGDTELAQTIQQEADKLEQQGQISDTGRKTIKLKSSKTIRLG